MNISPSNPSYIYREFSMVMSDEDTHVPSKIPPIFLMPVYLLPKYRVRNEIVIRSSAMFTNISNKFTILISLKNACTAQMPHL